VQAAEQTGTLAIGDEEEQKPWALEL
jgi:hypothetical protein